MAEDRSPGSLPWLAGLIGQAWAPQPCGVSSERIQTIARRGLNHPQDMTPRDIMEICASVIAAGLAAK
jgi:hypothetical protein